MEVKILYQGCSYRQESTKQAEMERRQKYKKQEDEREVIRSSIRDKVGFHALVRFSKLHEEISESFSFSSLKKFISLNFVRVMYAISKIA